jgi:hypothetical protein
MALVPVMVVMGAISVLHAEPGEPERLGAQVEAYWRRVGQEESEPRQVEQEEKSSFRLGMVGEPARPELEDPVGQHRCSLEMEPTGARQAEMLEMAAY